MKESHKNLFGSVKLLKTHFKIEFLLEYFKSVLIRTSVPKDKTKNTYQAVEA
jgi:hypothetical protein